MCDTLAYQNPDDPHGRSLFGKNSDRDPGEPQIIQMCFDAERDFHETPYLESLPKYVDGPLKSLSAIFGEFRHPYAALLSRPVWMWGAEMGVNERGLAIGNEAVFSKEPLSGEGLLGMDILRLALHNCASAAQAVDFMKGIIERYGQGGNGSYKGKLFYHNSFLVKDPGEGYVLETSAHHWASRKLEGSGSISNSYSIRTDYGEADPESGLRRDGSAGRADSRGSFKGRYEKRLFAFVSKGDSRRAFSSGALHAGPIGLTEMKAILRSHMSPGNQPHRRMRGICLHARGLSSTETTSSMIVDYLPGRPPVCWYTSSPFPCVSLYKPYVLPDRSFIDGEDPFVSPGLALARRRRLAALSDALLRDYRRFDRELRPLRDEYERRFEAIISRRIQDATPRDLYRRSLECLSLEDEWIREVEGWRRSHRTGSRRLSAPRPSPTPAAGDER